MKKKEQMFPSKNFTDWLKRQLYVDRDEGRCVRLALRHVGGDKKIIGDVHSIRVPKGPTQEFEEATALELIQAAEVDANGIGGVQTYVVQAFYEEDTGKAGARYSLRVASDDEEEDGNDKMSSEPATKQGLLGQLMRHNEANARVNTAGFGQIVNAQQRMIERMENLVEKLVEDKMENIGAIEEMLSKKQERDLAAARQEQQMKMHAEVAEKLMLLAPVVVNKIAGQKLLAETNPALQGFMESISPEQFAAMQQILKPEQMLLVMDMMQSMQKKDDGTNGKAKDPNAH